MKRIITLILAIILASGTLIGCTKGADYIPDTTEKPGGIVLPEGGNSDTSFKDFVVCSDNFAFYEGEYNYFFMKTLSEALENIETKYDFDPDKSLKEQYVKNSDKTWFDIFKTATLDYMKELLYIYEEALREGSLYTSSADFYIKNYVIPSLKQASNGDPDGYIYEQFGGMVLYQNYLNAVYMEYLSEIYMSARTQSKFDTLTPEAVAAYAEERGGTKNENPTRIAVYVRVPSGKNKAEEFISKLQSAELTKDALISLAESYDFEYYEDSFGPAEKNYAEISKWLYADGRNIGDIGAVEVKDDSYYAVFYAENGEAIYLYEARVELAYAKAREEIDFGADKYEGYKISEEKLNAIDV